MIQFKYKLIKAKVVCLGPVWPELAKFGKIFKVLGKILRVYLTLGKILKLIWQILFAIVQLFIAINEKNLKNNLAN